MDPNGTCVMCRYWQHVGEQDAMPMGECHRYPPRDADWPMTQGDDWCGEFGAKVRYKQR